MPNVTIRTILESARHHGYAVPSLLAGNLEMVTGMVAAAERLRAPLILAFNRHVTPEVPIQISLPMTVNAARRSRAPIATFLDHGSSLDEVCLAIQLGASSVMFDGSHLPYDENVRQTREVVRVARAVGVSVEAELGSIGGSAVEIGRHRTMRMQPSVSLTPPWRPTLCNAPAWMSSPSRSAMCTALYQRPPRLDLERVRAIRERVAVPLAMHGGSGLNDAEYPPIIAAGISKLGYYSAMGLAAVDFLRSTLAAAEPATLSYHHTITAMVDFFRAETEHIIHLANCAGRVSV
jgi:fructose-bisphosphate aldolase class II